MAKNVFIKFYQPYRDLLPCELGILLKSFSLKEPKMIETILDNFTPILNYIKTLNTKEQINSHLLLITLIREYLTCNDFNLMKIDNNLINICKISLLSIKKCLNVHPKLLKIPNSLIMQLSLLSKLNVSFNSDICKNILMEILDNFTLIYNKEVQESIIFMIKYSYNIVSSFKVEFNRKLLNLFKNEYNYEKLIGIGNIYVNVLCNDSKQWLSLWNMHINDILEHLTKPQNMNCLFTHETSPNMSHYINIHFLILSCLLSYQSKVYIKWDISSCQELFKELQIYIENNSSPFFPVFANILLHFLSIFLQIIGSNYLIHFKQIIIMTHKILEYGITHNNSLLVTNSLEFFFSIYSTQIVTSFNESLCRIINEYFYSYFLPFRHFIIGNNQNMELFMFKLINRIHNDFYVLCKFIQILQLQYYHFKNPFKDIFVQNIIQFSRDLSDIIVYFRISSFWSDKSVKLQSLCFHLSSLLQQIQNVNSCSLTTIAHTINVLKSICLSPQYHQLCFNSYTNNQNLESSKSLTLNNSFQQQTQLNVREFNHTSPRNSESYDEKQQTDIINNLQDIKDNPTQQSSLDTDLCDESDHQVKSSAYRGYFNPEFNDPIQYKRVQSSSDEVPAKIDNAASGKIQEKENLKQEDSDSSIDEIVNLFKFGD